MLEQHFVDVSVVVVVVVVGSTMVVVTLDGRVSQVASCSLLLLVYNVQVQSKY